MMVQISYLWGNDYDDTTMEGHAVAGCGTCKRDVSYSLKYNYGHAWEVKYDTVIIGIKVILGKSTFTEKLKYVATYSVTMVSTSTHQFGIHPTPVKLMRFHFYSVMQAPWRNRLRHGDLL
jgi:hypothetical protein